MTLEMYLINIGILVVLTFLMHSGLHKVINAESVPVSRVYWFLLLPTYVLATVFTILLLLLGGTGSLELLLTLQKFAMGAHILACLLFIAACDGERMIAKAMR